MTGSDASQPLRSREGRPLISPYSSAHPVSPVTPSNSPGRALHEGDRPEVPGILLVDDDATVLRLLELVLQRRGFQIFLARNGREAVTQYQAHQAKIHVVLLDVCMPELDGPQTLEQLRRIQPAVVACFMSGYTGLYTPQELLQRGAVHFFSKPFRLDELGQSLWLLASQPRRCSA